MNLNLRTKILIVVVYTATAVAVGRYTVPEKIKIETKVVTVEKQSEDKDINQKKNTKHTVVVNKDIKPDGEKIITSTSTDEVLADTNTDTKKEVIHDTDTEKSKEVTHPSDKVTVSALGGIDLSTMKPVYGASVTKPILGPIAVGLFGLSNGACGASVGLTF